jgi:sugar phosphate isomerase/epimerase
MRFGLCGGPENLDLAGRLGFDYVEWGAASIEALGREDFAVLEKRVEKSPVKAERFNLLFPGNFRLIGPEADRQAIGAYLDRAFPRVRALGGTLVVFGSGRCRSFPPGMPFREGFRQLVELTTLIGDRGAAWGITVAIEPLNREETNAVIRLREGAMLEAAVNHPSVGLLADLYHLLKEGEGPGDILAAGELWHTHVALLEGRAFPTAPHPALEDFFRALEQISYTGTMSIEGRTGNLEQDGGAALETLRAYRPPPGTLRRGPQDEPGGASSLKAPRGSLGG